MQVIEELDVDMNQVYCEAWPNGFEELAARIGLLLCGDFRSAASMILRLEGWNVPLSDPSSQEKLRRSTVVQRLIQFALSEEYLQVRYAVGLSGRPSRLGPQ